MAHSPSPSPSPSPSLLGPAPPAAAAMMAAPGPDAAHAGPARRPEPPPAPSPAADSNDDDDIIDHVYDDAAGNHVHRILRLRPTAAQWLDFPAVLACALRLGARHDGCFKVSIPDGIHDALPPRPARRVPANAFRIRQIRKTAFWQVSTVPSHGDLGPADAGPGPGPGPGPDAASSSPDSSVDAALRALKRLFRSNRDRQMRSVRYRVDVPAWTPAQRRRAGVPERSPIHPLRGDRLDHTRALVPGIHTPYVYESGPHFGATFQIHAEDFRLASLNHLYRGRKIWIVVPATAVDVAERALGRGRACSQFMRHRAEFVFPDRLDKLGIPYRLVDQRPGETVVVLPDAYHEGFSTGYTIAEAKNYADATWDTASYQPCEQSCRLPTAIPAAFMRPLADGEPRLDLCAAYGDDGLLAQLGLPGSKRARDEDDGGGGGGDDSATGHGHAALVPADEAKALMDGRPDAKRIKA